MVRFTMLDLKLRLGLTRMIEELLDHGQIDSLLVGKIAKGFSQRMGSDSICNSYLFSCVIQDIVSWLQVELAHHCFNHVISLSLF